MIIEFHVTEPEALENDDHLGFCEDKECKHLAHLFEDVMDGYPDAVDVFAFVERASDGYRRRVKHNNVRKEREKWFADGDPERLRTLAIIRRGWDRLYGAYQRDRTLARDCVESSSASPAPWDYVEQQSSQRPVGLLRASVGRSAGGAPS